MKRKYVLVDIDHVISNAFHRDHLIGGCGGWDFYHSESAKDQPVHDIVFMMQDLHAAGRTIVALTARPEKWRTLTMSCLAAFEAPVDELLMRPDAAYHPAPEIKVQLALSRFGDKLKDQVAFLLDDRDDVCKAFRDLGITTMQVHARKD